MSFLTVLPMALVMIAGPQLLSAIFLATSERWRSASAAYLLGAAVAVTTAVTVCYLLALGGSKAGASDDALYAVVLVLLLAAMVHTFRARRQSAPPKWMGRLQDASTRFAFVLGFLLLGVFPTDILTSAAVGSYLHVHEDELWGAIPFIALTFLLLSLPALTLVLFGERAERLLPKVRTWMTTNAWIVNEVVLAFFVAIVIGDLA